MGVVYIVEQGEEHGDIYIEGVFSTLGKAQKRAKELGAYAAYLPEDVDTSDDRQTVCRVFRERV